MLRNSAFFSGRNVSGSALVFPSVYVDRTVVDFLFVNKLCRFSFFWSCGVVVSIKYAERKCSLHLRLVISRKLIINYRAFSFASHKSRLRLSGLFVNKFACFRSSRVMSALWICRTPASLGWISATAVDWCDNKTGKVGNEFVLFLKLLGAVECCVEIFFIRKLFSANFLKSFFKTRPRTSLLTTPTFEKISRASFTNESVRFTWFSWALETGFIH